MISAETTIENTQQTQVETPNQYHSDMKNKDALCSRRNNTVADDDCDVSIIAPSEQSNKHSASTTPNTLFVRRQMLYGSHYTSASIQEVPLNLSEKQSNEQNSSKSTSRQLNFSGAVSTDEHICTSAKQISHEPRHRDSSSAMVMPGQLDCSHPQEMSSQLQPNSTSHSPEATPSHHVIPSFSNGVSPLSHERSPMHSQAVPGALMAPLVHPIASSTTSGMLRMSLFHGNSGALSFIREQYGTSASEVARLVEDIFNMLPFNPSLDTILHRLVMLISQLAAHFPGLLPVCFKRIISRIMSQTVPPVVRTEAGALLGSLFGYRVLQENMFRVFTRLVKTKAVADDHFIRCLEVAVTYWRGSSIYHYYTNPSTPYYVDVEALQEFLNSVTQIAADENKRANDRNRTRKTPLSYLLGTLDCIMKEYHTSANEYSLTESACYTPTRGISPLSADSHSNRPTTISPAVCKQSVFNSRVEEMNPVTMVASTAPSSANAKQRTVYLSRIPPNTNPLELLRALSLIGNVHKVRACSVARFPTYFCFVEFATVDAAQRAAVIGTLTIAGAEVRMTAAKQHIQNSHATDAVQGLNGLAKYCTFGIDPKTGCALDTISRCVLSLEDVTPTDSPEKPAY